MKERDNRPIDVKFAEGGKKLKIIEAGVGGVIGVFISPVIGASVVLFQAGEWWVMNKYVGWRMKGKNPQRQMLLKAA